MRGIKAKRMRQYYGESRKIRQQIGLGEQANVNAERKNYQKAKKAIKLGRMIK